MREAAHEAAWQFHTVKEHLNPFGDRLAFERAVVVDGFGHLIGQLHLRIERREGVLEDHLHVEPGIAQLA